MNYKEYFKDKRVTVVGLGPHGEMMADIKFLLKNCAEVVVCDLRSEKRLKGTSAQLKDLGVSRVEFGKISQENLKNAGLILLSPEISKKSLFLKSINDSEIAIEYPETLFFKLAPSVTLVGVMGEYGKSTVTNLIHQMLKKGFEEYEDQGLFLLDPDSTGGTLVHLKKIKKGDVVLARIPESLLPHLFQIRISPHVAVVISSVSFDILEFQTYNNFIVAPDHVVDLMKAEPNFQSKAKILRTRNSLIAPDWMIQNYPLYNHENIALAFQTAELFKVSAEIIKKIAREFVGLKGRLEFVKKVNGVEFYNDASSITPGSTLVALKSLKQKDENSNIILIVGGAYTGRDYSELVRHLPEFVSSIILLSGSGIVGLRSELKKIPDIEVVQVMLLEDAVVKASEMAKKGDRVLFSPAFDAVGVDISRKERGEKFVKSVRSIS